MILKTRYKPFADYVRSAKQNGFIHTFTQSPSRGDLRWRWKPSACHGRINDYLVSPMTRESSKRPPSPWIAGDRSWGSRSYAET